MYLKREDDIITNLHHQVSWAFTVFGQMGMVVVVLLIQEAFSFKSLPAPKNSGTGCVGLVWEAEECLAILAGVLTT